MAEVKTLSHHVTTLRALALDNSVWLMAKANQFYAYFRRLGAARVHSWQTKAKTNLEIKRKSQN